MPFVAYVHAREPDRPEDEGRAPWEPDWRIWRWVAVAVALCCLAPFTAGWLKLGVVFLAFALCLRAASEALRDGDGLRDWRQ